VTFPIGPATVTITDNDSKVTVSPSGTASEAGPTSGTYTFTRVGNITASLTVNFTMSGLALSGTDYLSLGTSVGIPPDSSTATRILTPIDDSIIEGAENAVLTLATGSYIIGTAPGNSATLSIADNDCPVPGSTAITLQTANTGRVIVLPVGQSSQRVTLGWTAAPYADSYDLQLYRFDGGPANGGFTLQGTTDQTSALSKSYSALTEGYYAFFVRGTNCAREQLGTWAGLTFAIVANGNLTPKNPGQHNNLEDVCECDSPPPGVDVSGARVGLGDGRFSAPAEESGRYGGRRARVLSVPNECLRGKQPAGRGCDHFSSGECQQCCCRC
jgi:hypothetical protein